MIIISDKPVDGSAISRAYPVNSIEWDIINTMSQSEEEYIYDTSEQFNFEIWMRQEIIEASRQLNRSGMSFSIFRKSRCNTRYWERTSEGGFISRRDVRPNDATFDIFVNGRRYATECATAMVMVYYKALLSIYPEQLYNQIFPQIYLMNWHNLDPLLEEIGDTRESADFLPGDRLYFANPDVDPIHAYMQGENVIDLGNGTYYGHGIGIGNEKKIIRVLNQYRKPDAEVSAYLLNVVGRPNFRKLANIYHQFI